MLDETVKYSKLVKTLNEYDRDASDGESWAGAASGGDQYCTWQTLSEPEDADY
jgi:hypothetical protein